MTKETILKYEAMAKLRLTDENRQWAVNAINKLEESFKVLDTIDADGVSELVSVLDLKNVLRQDVASKFITRDELLSGAPDECDGYFQVPKTIE